MARLAGDPGKLKTGRARGRPSPDVAAQIDEEILRGAREMFLTHGYERTSMAMVTQAAGVSKTTLYARYATKADLFRATVIYTLELITSPSLKVIEIGEHELREGLRIYGCEAMRLGLTSPWRDYERLIQCEGGQFPELASVLCERIELRVDTVSQFITTCAERDGAIVGDPARTARVYIMALRGFITSMVLRGASPDEEEIQALTGDLLEVLLAGRAPLQA